MKGFIICMFWIVAICGLSIFFPIMGVIIACISAVVSGLLGWWYLTNEDAPVKSPEFEVEDHRGEDEEYDQKLHEMLEHMKIDDDYEYRE